MVQDLTFPQLRAVADDAPAFKTPLGVATMDVGTCGPPDPFPVASRVTGSVCPESGARSLGTYPRCCSHCGELFTGVREIFDDTSVSTDLADDRLKRVDDGRDVAVEFVFTVRTTVLTPVFHMGERQVENLEVGEEAPNPTGCARLPALELAEFLVALVHNARSGWSRVLGSERCHCV